MLFHRSLIHWQMSLSLWSFFLELLFYNFLLMQSNALGFSIGACVRNKPGPFVTVKMGATTHWYIMSLNIPSFHSFRSIQSLRIIIQQYTNGFNYLFSKGLLAIWEKYHTRKKRQREKHGQLGREEKVEKEMTQNLSHSWNNYLPVHAVFYSNWKLKLISSIILWKLKI